MSVDTTLFSTIGAAVIGAAGLLLSKRGDNKRGDLRVANAAADTLSQERLGLLSASQAFIASLQERIEASERDRQNLWRMFSEMQLALAACEEGHRKSEEARRSDATKILKLEQQNAEYAWRIQTLERRDNGDSG